MCRYDKALYYGQLSPWCAAFSNSDLLVLEYIDDLLYYYKDGYGYDINWMQACNPVVDVATYFNSIVLGATVRHFLLFSFGSHGQTVGSLGTLQRCYGADGFEFRFHVGTTMEHVSHAKFRRQHGLRLVQMRIEHVQSSIVRQRAIDPHSRMRHGYLPLFRIRRHRPAYHRNVRFGRHLRKSSRLCLLKFGIIKIHDQMFSSSRPI